MAEGDTTVAGGAGPINPSEPFAFLLGGRDLGSLSLEEIKRRRAIALALASRNRGFPKTLGEGLTSLGESVGDIMAERSLGAAEKAYAARRAADPDFRMPGAGGNPVTTTPVAPAAAPSAAIPGAVAGVSPQEQRARLAALLTPHDTLTPQEVAQQNPTLGAASPPVGPRLASVNPAGTMSDAPPVGVPPVPDENPPTPTNIPPIMLAQAGAGAPARGGGAVAAPPPPASVAPSGVGAVPGVFDKVTSPPPPTVTGPPVDPAAQRPITHPVPPRMQETLTDEERRGWAIIRRYPGDEQAQLQAKQLIDFGAARRKADYDRQVKEYDTKMQLEQQRILAEDAYRRTKPKTDFEFEEAQKKAAREQREAELFPLGKDKHIGFVEKSAEKVAALPQAQMAISGVRQLLASDAGMFTGSPANMKLSLAKWAQAVGAPYDPRIDNTETFRGLITPIIAALRPAIVGTGAQSLPEFKTLQDAAAGNITLERGSIEKIMAAVERLNAYAAIQHAKVLSVNSQNDPKLRQSFFGNFELPMEKFIPPSKVELLRRSVARDPASAAAEMEEFDRTYFSPGLAQRLLGR